MENQYKYTVCIHCMTYNHENYLADALEGFVMQKTTFPFVAVVIDDFSTDGTADVLRKYEAKYPDIIKAVYLQENYYSQRKSKNPFLEPYDSQSKYIALCEGDDYWTDPYKLQKQVDFLDSHPDYVACFHNARIKYNNGWGLFNALDENHYPTTEDIIKRRWFIATQTLLYRNVDIPIYEWQNKVISGDYTLELKLAKMGRFYYMDDVMAVYRQTGMGASAGLNKNKLKMYDQLIWLLSNMKDVYGGMYAQAFDESIANYEAMKSDFIRSTDPIKKWFYRKTYTRAVKRWLSFIV